MKNTKKCPKCNSFEIVVVEGRPGAGTGANNIPMKAFSRVVLISRYVCTACGYSEEWVDEKDDLERLKKHYGQK